MVDSFIWNHGEAKVLITIASMRSYAVAGDRLPAGKMLVIDVDDPGTADPATDSAASTTNH